MSDMRPGWGPGSNTGHGHVWERPDGVKARCGGPAICSVCAKDQAQFKKAESNLLDAIEEISERNWKQILTGQEP